jgi:hypothetical protein
VRALLLCWSRACWRVTTACLLFDAILVQHETAAGG